MGRPREFNPDTALTGAMEIFWRQGFKATNLPDLLDAMGLTRGSFYKAFGDKEAAYLAALDQYEREVIARTEALLDGCQANTASACLSQLFAAENNPRRGCFLCNAIVELAADNPKVAAKAKAMTDRLRGAIEAVLLRYRASDTPEQTANLILHLYFGFQALGKAGGRQSDWKRHLQAVLKDGGVPGTAG